MGCFWVSVKLLQIRYKLRKKFKGKKNSFGINNKLPQYGDKNKFENNGRIIKYTDKQKNKEFELNRSGNLLKIV